MDRELLVRQIHKKQNVLCVGLDPDLDKMPSHLLDFEDPIFEFCKEIIENTSEITVAYKPNLAFFECHGTKGWYSLEKVMKLIPESCFTIADAKRGDIGNTSKMYAKCFFEYFNFDAVTVAPYMGRDSVEPFLAYKDKWVIVLGLTSNEGAADFELLSTPNGQLFEEVIRKAASWGSPDNMMFVVGATKESYFKQIRNIVPDHFLLIPGIGAQGGSLHDVCTNCKNNDIGILINNGRNILYAGNDLDFGTRARDVSLEMALTMKNLLDL